VELRLERRQYKPGSTVGRLFVDGVFECYTLEDGIRTHKVYGETAIPVGSYPVVVNYSPRFRTSLPLLRDVPNFDGIRIHPGNAPKDTLGCILVGRSWASGAETVTASRLAFEPLKTKIQSAIERGEQVLLHIVQDHAPPELAARALKHEVKTLTRAQAASKRKPARAASKKTAQTRRTNTTQKTPARRTQRPTARHN
jgi:hypothetical protein